MMVIQVYKQKVMYINISKVNGEGDDGYRVGVHSSIEHGEEGVMVIGWGCP